MRQSRTYWICSAPNFRNRDFTTSAGISSPEMRIAARLEQTTSSINSTSHPIASYPSGCSAQESDTRYFLAARRRYSVRWPAAPDRIRIRYLFLLYLFLILYCLLLLLQYFITLYAFFSDFFFVVFFFHCYLPNYIFHFVLIYNFTNSILAYF